MYPYFKAHTHVLRFLIFTFVLGVSGVIISARWKQTEPNSFMPMKAVSESATVVSLQRQRNVTQVESEIITITPIGFDPGEITRPKGPLCLRSITEQDWSKSICI